MDATGAGHCLAFIIGCQGVDDLDVSKHSDQDPLVDREALSDRDGLPGKRSANGTSAEGQPVKLFQRATQLVREVSGGDAFNRAVTLERMAKHPGFLRAPPGRSLKPIRIRHRKPPFQSAPATS
ncbi:hypothetical protein MXAN_4536 [Myxococcus xanthus DK 1622]|uniref:Uncharacterized protein n=1 Tax=Myxococcus xanthus (strain DK1622) TaxID=246197 RepID=Q1D3R9_MYXXD|nr:hypothetical protein MXAN_4536 [Myxococcus xanthus DK 1622]